MRLIGLRHPHPPGGDEVTAVGEAPLDPARAPSPESVLPDPETLLQQLADSVERALPAGLAARVFVVSRRRSLGDRLGRRPGPIVQLRLDRDDESLLLARDSSHGWRAEAGLVYEGSVVARRPVPLGVWLADFAATVAALADRAAEDAARSAVALEALGIRPAGSDIAIGDATTIADLESLAGRLRGRIPPAALASVARIASLLCDTLPRVATSREQDVIVRRTATVYLPDTLRVYLSIPAEWAAVNTFDDGRSASEVLMSQLDTIESATKNMHDAAVGRDATALLVNGRFLAQRWDRERSM